GIKSCRLIAGTPLTLRSGLRSSHMANVAEHAKLAVPSNASDGIQTQSFNQFNDIEEPKAP
ncbi:hypothetical protein, partial [Rhodopirellula baltica]|uniref:hypothetical protein n=1 Tax=Rhodopirellula baltica TaxID=265606 RepID=UPI001F1F614B